MPVKTFSSYDEFKAVINGDKPVVIDFWATWCGPCRVISPVFEKLSDDPAFAGVEFYKVDVDQQDQISQEVGVRAKGQPPEHPVRTTGPIGVVGVNTCNPKMIVTPAFI